MLLNNETGCSGIGSRGTRGRGPPNILFLGDRNIIRPPFKTDTVTLYKVFSNFFNRTYLHFKVKIENI